MQHIHINRDRTIQLLDFIKQDPSMFSFKESKNLVELLDKKNNRIGQLYLPINIRITSDLEVDDLYTSNYNIILIQSGACAMGYFEDEEILDHKVFKTYMVRKKQGKSQLSYLNSKGKSRAGSRIRLSNSVQFFKDINERLHNYSEEHQIDKIAISCSKTLLPYLFNSKPSPPFEKTDRRIYKIPIHINTPNYETLKNTQAYLSKAHLIFENQYREQIETLL